MGTKHSHSQKTNHYKPNQHFKDLTQDYQQTAVAKLIPNKFYSIQSFKQINCDYKCLCRIAYFGLYQQFIISDCEDNTLKIIDYNGNYVNSINPNSILKCPWAVFISKQNEIFVADGQLGKIIVFNSQFKYLRDFGDNKIDLVECLVIDEEAANQQHQVGNKNTKSVHYSNQQQLEIVNDAEELLYAADYRNSLITIWNSKTGKFKDQFKIQSPCDIAINEQKLYVTSENVFKFQQNTRKLNHLNGDNCIYVLDKKSYCLLNKIKLNNWLAPNCIYFDRINKHIITIAFNVDSDMNVSKTRYLYIIDQETSTCLYKINLNVDKTSDMCIVDNKILFVRGPFNPPICMIEF